MKTLIIALATAVALSGCFSAITEDQVDRLGGGILTEIDPLSLFDLENCNGISMLQPTDPTVVQALLPEGLEPASYVLPVVGINSQQAILAVEILRCDAIDLNGDKVWVSRAFTFVRKPDFLPSESGGDYQYIFEIIGGKDSFDQLMRVLDYPVRSNDTAIVSAADPVPGVMRAVSGDYNLQANIIGPASNHGSFAFYWYHHDDSGDWLVWNGTETFPNDQEALGSYRVPTGSPFSGLGAGPGDYFGLPGYQFIGASFTEMSFERLRL